MRLTVELEGCTAPLALPGDGAAVAAFLSFCTLRGFGADHPLLRLAETLDLEHGVRIGPFTRFYGASVEDEEDASKLDLAWQLAGPLATSARAAASAIETSEPLRALATGGGAPTLAPELAALATIAEGGGDRQIRLSFTL